MLKTFNMAIPSKAILAPTIPYVAASTCFRWKWRSVAEIGAGVAEAEVGGGGWRRVGGGHRRRSVKVGGGG